MSTTPAAAPGGLCDFQYRLVWEIDHVGRGRAPLGEVFGGVGITHQDRVVPAGEGAVQRGADAGIGLGAGDDQAADAALRELALEIGVLERVAVLLVDQRFGLSALELVDVLPLIAPRGRSSECAAPR